MLWRDRWRGPCEEVAIKNLDRPDDDPMKTIGIDHLIGTGKFTDPRLQAKDASLVDIVEACNKIGTTSFQMNALAEEFAVALRGDKKCYNCGKPGHLKAQCRAKGEPGQNHSQYQQQTVTPVQVCARCQKGGHTARLSTTTYGGKRPCYNCGKPGHLKAQLSTTN
uniref:CCHC-type domain-containing protein n=1 Tax=Buteo japonicus TaxID=224669 RepID=A0A8C0AMD5_9AVES